MKRILMMLLLVGSLTSIAQENRVLLFSKTAGFRHSSIEEGKVFFTVWGKENNIGIDITENAEDFNEDNLKRYNAVVFLSTTGDVLSPTQQADFERFIQAGGGYMGIHAASDTEYNWPWYNDLMGGYFASHPGGEVSNVQNGLMITLDKNHPSTAHFPDTFERKDEFYDFKSLKTDKLKFLVRVDETSYKMGKMGDFHPMAWYHEFDGGKSFYSNYGHTPETFSESLMQKHFGEGLRWTMAQKLNYSKARTLRTPEENRFVKTNLLKNLDEPTELAVMPNGKVIFGERKGLLKIWNPKTKTDKVVAKMDVYTKFEYGLMGVSLDPNFEKNNWIYLYYTPTSDQHTDQFLSRFVYDQEKDTLLFDTEKVILRVPVKRVECCHTGGSIDWDSKGNLYLSTGDDTNPFASDGFAPIDFREGREGWDALHTSGNTNSLRGKILRIKPTLEGSYTIPEGNLFAEGTAKTRPEIYIMGCRNPYRIFVDKTTDYLYWGDIGPDAGKEKADRGPAGMVEFNQARKAGNYGWPLFVGDNFAYNAYDFETKVSGEKFNPEKPMNNSPHNTGLVELPPTQRPMVWYGYDDSKEFPLLGKGGANPMAGPVYHPEKYEDSPTKFPSYFANKFFAYEWMRDWIILINLDEKGNYVGMENFMPSTKFYHPMDMEFHKDGTLYLLEYGLNWFAQNEEAILSVIEYNTGNRKPIVKMSASTEAGATPLMVSFSSAGTLDHDKDALTYLWEFSGGLQKIKPNKLPNPTVTFKKPGIYEVTLTVTDSQGNASKESMFVKVGNEVPKIDIALNGNQTFFFDEAPIDYQVNVTDKEDGTLKAGTITDEDVAVSINYLEGFDKTMIEQGHKSNTGFVAGKRLIELSDCKACHAVDKKSIGPSYLDISKKYRRGETNISMLANKVINGGGGVWGEQAMSAHPQLSKTEARDMVDYILSLNDKTKKSEPTKAAYAPAAHKGKKEGAYLIQATYTDKGGNEVGPQTATKTVALRSSKVPAVSFDEAKKSAKFNVPQLGEVAIANHEGYLRFNAIDLSGIKTLTLGAFASPPRTVGGKAEIRIGSETGQLIGEAVIASGNVTPQKITLNQAIQGKKDVFLVFSNKDADGKALFALTFIEFK
jgi:cytochrome c